MLRSLVGSEMCIRDRVSTQSTGNESSGDGFFRSDARTRRLPRDMRNSLARLQLGGVVTRLRSPPRLDRVFVQELLEEDPGSRGETVAHQVALRWRWRRLQGGCCWI
eukprot:TRINITY_DN2960_c0_g1_i1.p4 TRINITY_DN2960_c0_g1~~TRINITY_DN2960_c0_g1_i1.p4  ORF type:complete len:107 (-),score=18.38 TRINITY_DN2960_c0_g1_i1:687-1007(-)